MATDTAHDGMDVDFPLVDTKQMEDFVERWSRSHGHTIYYCLPSALTLPTAPATADTHVLLVDLTYRPEAEYDAERFLVADAHVLPIEQCVPAVLRLEEFRKGTNEQVAMAVVHCEGAYKVMVYELRLLSLRKGVNEGWKDHLFAFANQGIRKSKTL